MKLRMMLLAVVTFVSISVSGCSESDRAWKDAQKLNTIEAYLSFQQQYPKSNTEKAAEAMRQLKWNKVLANKSLLDAESYIKEYPKAPNIEEARRVLDECAYNSEIGGLNERIKDYLNGNVKSNTIAALNGRPFVEKDQNKKTDIMFFGTSAFRVATKIPNPETKKVFSCVHVPTENLMVERIESVTPEEGVTLTFTNGHKYGYSNGKWKRNG